MKVILFFKYPSRYGVSETINDVTNFHEKNGIITIKAGNDNLSFNRDSISSIEVIYSNGLHYIVD